MSESNLGVLRGASQQRFNSLVSSANQKKKFGCLTSGRFCQKWGFWRELAVISLSAICCETAIPQSITPAPTQSQPQVTKSEEGKREEAERAAARAKAHHFDR